jgi:hypothetical protein
MDGGERRKEKERERGMVRGKAQKPAERKWSKLGRGVLGGASRGMERKGLDGGREDGWSESGWKRGGRRHTMRAASCGTRMITVIITITHHHHHGSSSSRHQ